MGIWFGLIHSGASHGENAHTRLLKRAVRATRVGIVVGEIRRKRRRFSVGLVLRRRFCLCKFIRRRQTNSPNLMR